MALYTYKSREEAMLPLLNYNGNSNWVRNQMAMLNGMPSVDQTQLYNAIGRTAGEAAGGQNNGSDNFFAKRGRSIENALGTTGASIVSFIDTARENDLIDKRAKDANKSIEDIIKNAGYNSKDEFYDASNKAEKEIFGKYGFDSDEYWNKHASMWSPAKANDKDLRALEATRQDVINRMSQEDADTIRKFDAIQDQLKSQSKINADIADKAARDWKDYRENSYVGQKINQDRGKFLGSAINTLSTGVDIAGLGANPLSNAIQGGIEGIADELEQGGLENFNWERAGQNALIGATTGAVTGALNKGISNSLAKNGGNLFKGGNALTRGLNNLGSKTAVGRVGSTLATGAARGAVSGAVGGATGAGLQSAINGVDFGQGVQNALQGAVQGAKQGAATGATMAGANMAISKTPGVGKFYNELQNAKTNWDQSGSNFDERLTNTLTSGDSAVGDWLMNKRQSKALGAIGNIGNRIADTTLSRRITGAMDEAASIEDEPITNPRTAREYMQMQKGAKALSQERQQLAGYQAIAQDLVEKLGADADSASFAALRNLAEKGSYNPTAAASLLASEADRLTMLSGGENLVDDIKTGMNLVAQNSGTDLGTVLSEVEQWDRTPTSAPAYREGADEARAARIRGILQADTPTAASKYVGVDTLGNRTEYTPQQLAKLINEYDNYKQPSTLSGNSFDEVSDVVGPAGSELMNIYKTMNGGVPVDPYSRESWGEFENWLNTQRSNTPTTAKGWLKQAGKRIVEDANNKGVGLSVKDINEDMPEDIRNMKIRDYNVSQSKNGPTPSGLDKVTKAFDESVNQRVLTNRGGKDFALGEFGSNNLQRKVNAQHNLSEADIKNIIDTSDRQSVSGDSSFRKDNVAWFGDLPNGERGTVITRLNSLGQEEVINAYKNNPGYEAELLKTYGTPAQSRTGSLGLEDLGDESATQGRSSIIQQNRQNVNLADPWDRVAQEAGYSNYDEVLQRYAEANPNAKINPRGMAGQVLTWLDQNPNTPTTTGGWMKRAGQRAVEDINNSNLGLRVKDVSEDDPSKQLYNALVGNSQPATEAEVETEADMGTIPSKTSKASKLRYAHGKELLAQYGTVDAPMARATNAVKTFQRISDMGFEKPTDVESISNAITGANGYASTLNRNIIKSAKPVDTFTGDNGQTIDDFVDNSIEHNMLSGTNQGVAVKRSINAYLKSLPSRAEGSVDYTDSASDTFKVVQGLEARAAELEGRGGSTYHRATTEDLHQAAVLKDVASLLKDRIYDGADAKVAITPKVVKDMKALAPGNEKWAAAVDDFAKNVKTPQDIRSFQEPFVKAGRYIDNQYVQAATVGGRMAANAGELPDTLRTTKAGIINDLVNRAWNSNAAHRGRAALYGKLADRAEEKAANKAANNPTTAKGWAKQAGQRAAEDLGKTNLGNRIQDVSGQPINPQVATPAELANAVADYNPSTQLYNAIGRTEGALAQNTPAQYLADAAQEAEIVVPNTNSSTQVANTGNASTSMYNALAGTPTTATQATTSGLNTGYYQPTGDYWTDIIASAMSRAIDAEDVNAFATLFGMYQDALSNAKKTTSNEKDYSNPMNWSSADRTKLLSAQNAMGQIDQLEEAYNQATGGEGGNAIQGWLRSRASDISGGNLDPSAANYNSLSESVGMGIVKNLINLGVTEADAQRYLQYLPALSDTKEQAAQKLATLRSIYQNQINNLYGVYGL